MRVDELNISCVPSWNIFALGFACMFTCILLSAVFIDDFVALQEMLTYMRKDGGFKEFRWKDEASTW